VGSGCKKPKEKCTFKPALRCSLWVQGAKTLRKNAPSSRLWGAVCEFKVQRTEDKCTFEPVSGCISKVQGAKILRKNAPSSRLRGAVCSAEVLFSYQYFALTQRGVFWKICVKEMARYSERDAKGD